MPPKTEETKEKRKSGESSNEDDTVLNADPALSTSTDPGLTCHPSMPGTDTVLTRDRIPVHSPKKSICLPCKDDCFRFFYNKKKKTVCERTGKSWLKITGYSILYIIFLSTFTMIFLFCSLSIIKATDSIKSQLALLTRDPYVFRKGVGLHVIPAAENENSQIQFRRSEDAEYTKYTRPIAVLMRVRKNDDDLITSLGPCGVHPYGYGDNPCVIVKIDHPDWSDEPLSPNSTLSRFVPPLVKSWMESSERKLWLHCDGYSPYDRDNIGNVSYYPYPPGFDPDAFPLGHKESPLQAVQFSRFSQDVPITVVCKLWHESGPSSVFFTFYVATNIDVDHITSRNQYDDPTLLGTVTDF